MARDPLIPLTSDVDPLLVHVGGAPVTYARPVSNRVACHYCPNPATTRDHVVARALGGESWWWNLVPSCRPCNARKAALPSTCECPFCTRAYAIHARRKGITP